MNTVTYDVVGMHCVQCVGRVESEVGKLAGVTDVKVDLTGGTVTVTSQSVPDDAAVAGAVDAAGYAIATTQ